MDPAQLPRKLAAILYADVAGYSRLTGEDEQGTHQRLSSYLDRISASIERHHGKIEHYAGDAVLADFGTVSDALTCAASIQQDLEQSNADLPEDRKVRFRMGVNLGEVIMDRDDIYGDGVNIAARLEGLAEPGGICISESVHAAVGNKLPLDYEFLGEQNVKNIAKPVRAYHARLKPNAELPTPTAVAVSPRLTGWRSAAIAAVAVVIAATGLFMWLQPWAPRQQSASVGRMAFPLPDKPSIAVLPFANLGDDPEQMYFADGITEDLITDLSKIGGLFVIARNSTFVYKDETPDIREVAEALGVRYVLEGSVRRNADQVRINAQLIDATSSGHVWADRYDGSLQDVFGLQDQVTRKIVTVLAVQLTSGEEERVTRQETTSAEAYDAFLKGWAHYLRQRPDHLPLAIAQFQRSLELDPQYSRAYAALAATYWQAWRRSWHSAVGMWRWHDARVQAEALLEQAMDDPTPLAHQVASAMRLQKQQHDEAIAQAERAIALDPNDADSYIALASAFSFEGKPDESLEMVERAMRLNPHYPPFYLYELGLAQFGAEHFDQALMSLEKATTLNPDDRWSNLLLLATYGHVGRTEDAARVFSTISSWGLSDLMSIRSIAFWHPFKAPADAARFAEGLREAGVPD